MKDIYNARSMSLMLCIYRLNVKAGDVMLCYFGFVYGYIALDCEGDARHWE